VTEGRRNERLALAVEAPTELEERRFREGLRERLAQLDGLLLSDVPLASEPW